MRGWVDVQVKGLNGLKKNLNKLGMEMKAKGGERATRAGAAVILKAAKNNVPVKTGNLKKSLKAVRMSNKGSTWPKFWVAHSTGRGIKHDGWYANLVEFGGIKGAYKIKPRKRLYSGDRKKAVAGWFGGKGRSGGKWFAVKASVMHPQSRARPYMRPAFEANAGLAMNAMAKRMDRFIAKGK